MDYKFRPSDLTYFYEDCKHCFVLAVRDGIQRPSIPLPGVFQRISSLQKDYYSGRRTEEFCQELPPGVVKYGEHRVQSKVFRFTNDGFYISGRFDIVVEFDDASYGIIDFKTREEKDEPTTMFSRQLHAYAFALENAAPDALALAPVTRLGLLYFDPSSCELRGARQFLSGELKWVEIPRDDKKFKEFLREVMNLLSSKQPLPQVCARCSHCGSSQRCKARYSPGEKQLCICCAWCVYRADLAGLR